MPKDTRAPTHTAPPTVRSTTFATPPPERLRFAAASGMDMTATRPAHNHLAVRQQDPRTAIADQGPSRAVAVNGVARAVDTVPAAQLELVLEVLPRRESRASHLPPAVAAAPEPERLRFELDDWTEMTAAGHNVQYRKAARQANGAALSSVLTTGEHAPVVAVAGRAHCAATTVGTTVTFEGWFPTRKASEYLALLTQLGMASSVRWPSRAAVRAASSVPRLRPSWSPITRTIQVDFPFAVEARTSQTSRRRTDLFFNTAMQRVDAYALVRALELAGLVSVLDACTEAEGKFTLINRPL